MSEVPLYPQAPASSPAQARVEQGRRKRSRPPSHLGVIQRTYRGTSSIKKRPPTLDPHRALGMVLL